MCAIMCNSLNLHPMSHAIIYTIPMVSSWSVVLSVWTQQTILLTGTMREELTTNVTIVRFASVKKFKGLIWQQASYFQISRLGLKRLDIIPGHYYCQIQPIDNNTGIEFEPSNTFYSLS